MSTDNSDIESKLKVRRAVMAHVNKPVSVLDLYCGHGVMFENVWKGADKYFGVDKYSPHALGPTAKMRAEVAVRRLDLDGFNLFDVDTYNSPWVVARQILKRRGGGQFGIVLTSGEDRGLKNGYANEIIRRSIGASGLSDYRLFTRFHRLVMLLMIRSLWQIRGIVLEKGWMIITNRNVTYVGLCVNKT